MIETWTWRHLTVTDYGDKYTLYDTRDGGLAISEFMDTIVAAFKERLKIA